MANPFERDHEDPRGGIDLDQQVMGDFPEHAGKGARRETRTRLVWNVIVHFVWFCLFGCPRCMQGSLNSSRLRLVDINRLRGHQPVENISDKAHAVLMGHDVVKVLEPGYNLAGLDDMDRLGVRT